MKLSKPTPILIALVLALGAMISSCEKDEDPGGNGNGNGNNDPCATAAVSFSADLLPVIESTCSGSSLGSCHSVGAPQGDFTSYAGVKAKVDNGSMNQRVVVDQNMPPANSNGPTSLTTAELELFECWISDGAPDN